jgi:DtxR family Mn-dependent transcriptional regulator
MTDTAIPNLTPALEDYLETVFRLVAKHGFARVRDIATARDVRPASVSPAMRRLDELGLVEYERREYVGLTRAGEEAARRIYSRHTVMRRFFGEILGLPADAAEQNACAAEHNLTPEALDRLVRFFEYLAVCPEADRELLRFQTCSLVNPDVPPCPNDCPHLQTLSERTPTMSIADLDPGQRGRVTQVESSGAVRQRLLDMGLLPDAVVELARVAPAGDPVWIKLQGYELALRRSEAKAVAIQIESGASDEAAATEPRT